MACPACIIAKQKPGRSPFAACAECIARRTPRENMLLHAKWEEWAIELMREELAREKRERDAR